MKKLLAVIPIVLFALMVLPSASAHPVTASLSWSSVLIPAGGSTTASITVKVDPDCPIGGTFTGTLSVTQPDGVSVGTYSVSAIPCGTVVTAAYPGAFSGAASTSSTGNYKAVWAGSTSQAGVTFTLTDGFSVANFKVPGVPQFPIAGTGVVVLAGALGLLLIKRKFPTSR